MIYFKDAYVTVWEIDSKENYSVVSLSSSRKDKKNDKYVHSNWKYARFLAEAHTKAGELKERDRIKINGGFSWEPYLDDQGNKKWSRVPTLMVFDFVYPEAKPGSGNPDLPPVVAEEDDSIPF
jgi:hypothetical protein